MEKKIPKIIHYCWFGKKEFPEIERKCIKTWKKILPDYEFMFWNEDSFDIYEKEWCRTAYERQKYAFVADYVRLYVLYKYGGIYLDTDIKMVKSFDDLLKYSGFMCFIDVEGTQVSAGTIGIVKEHPIIRELLEYYDRSFTDEIVTKCEANTNMISECLIRHGLETNGKRQKVLDIEIFPRTFFCPMDYFSNWDLTKDTYCIHLFSGSWLPDEEYRKLEKRRKLIWRFGKFCYVRLKKISFIRKIRDWMKSNKVID